MHWGIKKGYYPNYFQTTSSTVPNDIIFEYKVYMHGLRYSTYGMGNITGMKGPTSLDPDGDSYYYRWDTDRVNDIYRNIGGTRTTLKNDCNYDSINTWVNHTIYYHNDGKFGHTFNANDDNVTDNTHISLDKKIFFGNSQVLTYGDTLDIEYCFVRKYTANEPTTSIGTEEHQRRIPEFV